MKKFQAFRFTHLAVVALSLLTLSVAHAQLLFSAGSPYSQNFDSLGATGTVIDNTTLPGWLVFKGAGTGAAGQVMTCTVGTGTSGTGAMYNYGSAAVPADRALGDVGSGTPGTFAYGVLFTNDTANSISNIVVSYTGEQWRNGGNASTQKLMFSYQISSSPITSTDPTISNTAPWIYVTTLDFLSPTVGATAAALDGNAAANRTAISATLSGVSVASGENILFRWLNPNDPGNDHGLALDDMTITYIGAAPNTNPPSITTQPSSITNNIGQNAAFSVQASGHAPLSYQWYYSNGAPSVAISGGVNSTLNLPAVTNANVGSYFVVVSNDVAPNTVTSSVVKLTIKPIIVTNIAYIKTLIDANYALTQADTNTVYQVEGIVITATNVVNSTASHSYYIEDPSSRKGLDVFFPTALFSNPNQGDNIRIVAPLDQFQGVIELVPKNTAHSITVLSTGNALPAPRLLDLANVGNAAIMDDLKGSYVIVTNVTLANTNSGVFDAKGDTVVMTGTSGTLPMQNPIPAQDPQGKAIPASAYSVQGVLAQSKSASPFNANYVLLLTLYADINTNAPSVSPIPLDLQRSGNSVVLSWSDATFSLQASPIFTNTPNASNPYFTNVPGATSPYTYPVASPYILFRLVH